MYSTIPHLVSSTLPEQLILLPATQSLVLQAQCSSFTIVSTNKGGAVDLRTGASCRQRVQSAVILQQQPEERGRNDIMMMSGAKRWRQRCVWSHETLNHLTKNCVHHPVAAPLAQSRIPHWTLLLEDGVWFHTSWFCSWPSLHWSGIVRNWTRTWTNSVQKWEKPLK